MLMRWCGTLANSSLLGLAVPISIPLYTSAESMLITSIGQILARDKASPVLPTPVGPVIVKQS